MKTIKILGIGDANSEATIHLINEAAIAKGIKVILEKIGDEAEIRRYGVSATPGIVIDGTVVHSGSIPSTDSINKWLDESTRSSGCCGSCS